MSEQEKIFEVNRNGALSLEGLAKNAVSMGHFKKAIEYLKLAISRTTGDNEIENLYRRKLEEVRNADKAADLIKDGKLLVKNKQFSEAEKKFDEAGEISKINKILEMIREARSKVDHQSYKKLMGNIELVNNILRGDFSKHDFQKMLYLLNECLKMTKEKETVDKLEKKKSEVHYEYGLKLFNKAKEAEFQETDFEMLQDHYEQTIDVLKNALNYKKKVEVKEMLRYVTLRFEGNKVFNEGVKAEENGWNAFHIEEYEKAYTFYQSAHKNYKKAIQTFTKGISLDNSFEETVEFLKEELEKIPDLVAILAKMDLKVKIKKTDFIERVNGSLEEDDDFMI